MQHDYLQRQATLRRSVNADRKAMRGCTTVRSLNNKQSLLYLNPAFKGMKDEGKNGGGEGGDGPGREQTVE